MPLYTHKNSLAGMTLGGPVVAWVHEKIFAGGGAHIPSTWDEFSSQMGIRAVVHLARPGPILFQGGTTAGFLWLDIEHESDADLPTRHLCGRFIQEAISKGQNVLLHSAHGRHRTRWLYVAYLICSGKQVRAALTLAEEKPWQAPYHTDRAAWTEFKNYLRES
jgi:hypothetical protein